MIKQVRLRNSDIWLPLFLQTSSADNLQPVITGDTLKNSHILKVTQDGNVTAAKAGNFKTQCDMDLSAFPVVDFSLYLNVTLIEFYP